MLAGMKICLSPDYIYKLYFMNHWVCNLHYLNVFCAFEQCFRTWGRNFIILCHRSFHHSSLWLQQISLLPVIVPEWISWAFFEIVICLLMKGQWIFLATILLLSRLTEPPSFMVNRWFTLPCLFQGAYILLLHYILLGSIFVGQRENSKFLFNPPSRLTGNDKKNRKTAQNGPRVGLEI